MNDRYSKLAFLHRVKERKTPSLSAQASFAFFSLKVAWSKNSLIGLTVMKAAVNEALSLTTFRFCQWTPTSLL